MATYGELKNGDHIQIQGYWFEVERLRSYEWVGPAMDSGAYGNTVIRFNGRALDEELKGTGFDGGVYGARDRVTCHIKGR